MSPHLSIVEYWKSEPNWIKRYIRGSYELNLTLCGLKKIIQGNTLWTKSAIQDFLNYMKDNRQVISEPIQLYRGTNVVSPVMTAACLEITNCQFMSTSKSKAIATEFAGKKGFIHILHCSKGVVVYDFNNIYGDDPVKREKEVLIYPGCKLSLLSKKDNVLHWSVTK
jgi:hypothetical protein